tara:strand:+ start:756 stop:1367 length:612 start_codon:yes stop_codon:yes gene_type:complete
MNVKLTGLILVVTILFFLVVGMDIFISQSRSFKKIELQEPPDSVKSQISREEKKGRRFSLPAPLPMGNSAAEQRYTAALDYLRRREIDRNERRYQKERIRAFMKSPAGESLLLGLNFLSDGQQEKARSHISEALGMHGNYDFADYVMMLKGLLHTYVRSSDRDDIDKAVMSYLSLIKNNYTNTSFQKVVDELIEALQEKISNE